MITEQEPLKVKYDEKPIYRNLIGKLLFDKQIVDNQMNDSSNNPNRISVDILNKRDHMVKSELIKENLKNLSKNKLIDDYNEDSNKNSENNSNRNIEPVDNNNSLGKNGVANLVNNIQNKVINSNNANNPNPNNTNRIHNQLRFSTNVTATNQILPQIQTQQKQSILKQPKTSQTLNGTTASAIAKEMNKEALNLASINKNLNNNNTNNNSQNSNFNDNKGNNDIITNQNMFRSVSLNDIINAVSNNQENIANKLKQLNNVNNTIQSQIAAQQNIEKILNAITEKTTENHLVKKIFEEINFEKLEMFKQQQQQQQQQQQLQLRKNEFKFSSIENIYKQTSNGNSNLIINNNQQLNISHPNNLNMNNQLPPLPPQPQPNNISVSQQKLTSSSSAQLVNSSVNGPMTCTTQNSLPPNNQIAEIMEYFKTKQSPKQRLEIDIVPSHLTSSKNKLLIASSFGKIRVIDLFSYKIQKDELKNILINGICMPKNFQDPNNDILYGVTNGEMSKQTDLLDVSNAVIIVTKTELKVLKKDDENQNDDYSFQNPSGICFDQHENIYICDSGNNRVKVLNKSLSLVHTIQSASNQFDLLSQPKCVTTHNDLLYVCDSANHRIVSYFILNNGTEFKFKDIYGLGYGDEPGMLRYPLECCVDNYGNLYVRDHHNSRVQMYGSDTVPFHHIEVNSQRETIYSMTVTDNGDIYVAKMVHVQETDANGMINTNYKYYIDIY